MAGWHCHHQFVLTRRRNHDAIARVFGHRESGVVQLILQTSNLLGQWHLAQSDLNLGIFLAALR